MKSTYIIVLYIKFTKTNIISTLVKLELNNNKIINSNILSNNSSGTCGFRNIQKKTPFACITVLTEILKKIKSFKIKSLNLYFKGESSLYNLALDTLLQNKNFKINYIIENSRYAYNGCRPSKNTNLLLNEYI